MSSLDIDVDSVFAGLEWLSFRGKYDEGVKKEVRHTCQLDKGTEVNDYHKRFQLLEIIYVIMGSRDNIETDQLALKFAAKYLRLYPAARETMTPQLLSRLEARERRELKEEEQREGEPRREEQQYTEE